MERICAWHRCRKVFETNREDQVYCCTKCQEAAGHRRQYEARKRAEGKTLKPFYTKTCAWKKCGKTFETTNSRQKYCCKECYKAGHRGDVEKRNETLREEKKREKAEKAKAEPATGSLLMRVDRPEQHEWEKEDEEMKNPLGERARETMPSIVPKPRCKLERDVLAARKAGAKSYGYYMAFQIIGK